MERGTRMDARKYSGEQQRRRREQNYSPRESGSTSAIILLTLLITAGTAVGLSIGFGFALLISAFVAGIVHIIKRLCLMRAPYYDRSTEAEPFKWGGYLLCTAFTVLFVAYGAYSLTGYVAESVATRDIPKTAPDAKPEGEPAPAIPSFADRDWLKLVNDIRSLIEARKISVNRLEDSDPMKDELKMQIFDAGRSLLRVDIALSDFVELASATPVIAPGGGRFDWRSNFAESDWRAPVKDLKDFVGQLDARVRLMEDSDPAKSRLLEQVGVVTSWLTNLEMHLSRFADQSATFKGMTFSLITGQGPAPEATSGDENKKSDAVATASPRPGFMPMAFMNFVEAAINGDPLVFALLIAAAILELLLYFKVKQKHRREQRDW